MSRRFSDGGSLCSDLWFGLDIRNTASQTDTLGTSFLGVLILHNLIVILYIRTHRRKSHTKFIVQFMFYVGRVLYKFIVQFFFTAGGTHASELESYLYAIARKGTGC